MTYNEIQTVPDIPDVTTGTTHRNIEIYGRGNYRWKTGTLIYCDSENGHPAGYRFEPVNDQAINEESMRQITVKMEKANAALKLGLL